MWWRRRWHLSHVRGGRRRSIGFGKSADESTAVDVEVERTELALRFLGLRVVEVEDAEGAIGGDGEVFSSEGAGEDPWDACDGVGEERDGLEGEEAPAVREGEVAGEESIDCGRKPRAKGSSDGENQFGAAS